MEGQEEWAEPGGEAMVAIAKFLLAPAAVIAFGWGALVVLAGNRGGVRPSGQVIATFVFSCLSLAFWIGGRVVMFLGRKMRERGIKLP
jgi:preprotein translocase subunit SecY